MNGMLGRAGLCSSGALRPRCGPPSTLTRRDKHRPRPTFARQTASTLLILSSSHATTTTTNHFLPPFFHLHSFSVGLYPTGHPHHCPSSPSILPFPPTNTSCASHPIHLCPLTPIANHPASSSHARHCALASPTMSGISGMMKGGWRPEKSSSSSSSGGGGGSSSGKSLTGLGIRNKTVCYSHPSHPSQ